MVQVEALFKVSYGLYLVCTGDRTGGNGFVSNTVFQVSSSPAKFAACCSKDNYTSELIRAKGNFSVSVLRQETSAALIGKFGYKTGRDTDKLEGCSLRYGETGVPIVLDDAIAFLECRVVDTQDVGSHFLFIAELVQSEVLEEGPAPLTYSYYREVKKGMAPKNAPTYVDKKDLERTAEIPRAASAIPKEEPASQPDAPAKDTAAEGLDTVRRWECAACGFVYDEAKEGGSFEDLPDDWVCPVCGTDKEDFYEL
jgi:flavin reductase (DIM6/NTAB) family NADH-FMN oxidoreductase RutF/rubredoxin